MTAIVVVNMLVVQRLLNYAVAALPGCLVVLPPEVQITHLLCYNLNWLLTPCIILNKVLCILIMSRHFTEYFSSKQPNKFTLVAAKTSLE